MKPGRRGALPVVMSVEMRTEWRIRKVRARYEYEGRALG